MITVPTLITLGVKNTFTAFRLVPPSESRILAVTLSSGLFACFAAADDESDQAEGAAARTARATVTPNTAKLTCFLFDRSGSWCMSSTWRRRRGRPAGGGGHC